MAVKGQKKKNIRLRRRIRKTLGSVCLITALLVAAIPVPEASASAEEKKYTWDEQVGKDNTTIPVIPKDCKTIYTTGNGDFQFAFVNASDTNPNKVAVILGYNGGNLANNALEIPNTVDAFTKFNENEGTKNGYVAVSKSQKPLYFMSKEPEVDVSGNVPVTTPAEYSPCYYESYSRWKDLALDQFYYLDERTGNYIQTVNEQEQWIKNLTVMYIGNQSLTENPDKSDGAVQAWVIAEASGQINTNPGRGIFAGNSNIVTLSVGENLEGIGNYAFYGCTNLARIQLGNGLKEIGKYAFADCANISNVGIEFASNLQYISDYTFLNCRALSSFTLPSSVTKIYDHAFEGCTSLSDLDISGIKASAGGEKKYVTLAELGYHVFKDCTSLRDVVLPDSIKGSSAKVHLNNFEGCTELQRIKAESANTIFEADNVAPGVAVPAGKYTVDMFKKDVQDTFYFEAAGTSSTHEFTKEHAIAFKYADRDCYEIIIVEKDTDGDGVEDSTTGVKITYQVNSSNELLYFNMNGEVAVIEIPASIGPYGISAINAGSFSENCFLKKIIIPATVSRINDAAFIGCHNLQHVIFTDASSITYIGSDAFATQRVSLHSEGCTNKDFLTSVKTPTLTFTGTVGTGIVPFDYAMSESSNINAGAQTKSYITYYSGWPTNLEIKYVMDENDNGSRETATGKATLVDYPTYEELKKASNAKYTRANYPYITEEHEKAAKEAVSKYEAWLADASVEVTSDQWDIINAALEVFVPTGVKAFSTGLFSGVEGTINEDGSCTVNTVSDPNAAGKPDTQIKEITFADISEFEPYSVSGCSSLRRIDIIGGTAKVDDYAFAYEPYDKINSKSALTTVSMSGGGSTVGNYAFDNNPALTNVTLSASVQELGKRPFRDCTQLESVNFSGSPYYTCESAIIFGLSGGSKDSVVQCLESRGMNSTTGSVSAGELSGITSLYEEAFMDCGEIGSIDLSDSAVKTIPVNAFAGTKSLYSLVLPTSCRSIDQKAFDNSNIRYVDIPSSVTHIDPKAFNTADNLNAEGKFNTIEFYCEKESAAETYANHYDNIKVTDKPVSTTFKVVFFGRNGEILSEQQVLINTAAVAPEAPEVEGYRFTGWMPANFSSISAPLTIAAIYEKIDSTENQVPVTFVDWDDTVLKTDMVTPGKDAEPPLNPSRDGYTFTGWRPSFTNIEKETTVYATYEKNDSSTAQHVIRFIDWDDTVLYIQRVDDGADAISPSVPGRDGYTFTGWRPDVTKVTRSFDTYAMYEKTDGTGGSGSDTGNGSGNGNGTGNGSGTGNGTGNGSGTGNGNGQTTAKYYTLTVKGGSGSGSYIAGTQPIIIANDPDSGMQFSHWTVDPEDTDIVSKVLSATVITMPEKNVTVTANYKKTTGGTVTGSGNSSSNNSNRPGTNTGTITSGGTTVVIDKNGLSNTGVVSAVVNGSSDNFTIKISESSSASEEVIKALMAEYGDISNIKYFPMDITLYDSTGKNKITDTTGLSISITLPLPDSLITYAGNNKVAGVVNGKLDKLSTKFTTISGVSCVTFKAEHFSPYVIYVNTQNLTAGTITDSTPKTGDGIHPKWFLSMGLACLSAVLFMKKDRRVAQKVRARV